MKNIFNHRWFLLILRWGIGGLFVYAGMVKTLSPQSFADSIETFKILPFYLINLFALGLPLFEILVGGLFLIGCQERGAAFSVLVLIAVFLFALVSTLARGIKVDCGCFGSNSHSNWNVGVALARDLVIAWCAWLVYRRELSPTKSSALAGASEMKGLP
ncbi:MAG: DoxX family membrane protein [Verrucomicrobiae bacterium]|nr:DoxX family membrane protein [Verrucomicrobiae bacterium]